jgi:hypothetical protein
VAPPAAPGDAPPPIPDDPDEEVRAPSAPAPRVAQLPGGPLLAAAGDFRLRRPSPSGYRSRWFYGFSYGYRAGLFIRNNRRNEDFNVTHSVGVILRHPYWYNRPFYYAPRLRGFLPVAAEGLWFYPYELAYPSTYWQTVRAIDNLYRGSVDDLQRLALPEGVMPPRSATAGFIYFQKVDPTARQVWLLWKPRSPLGQPIGRLNVHFARKD